MKVQLEDKGWYSCKIIGKAEALDYVGYRYNIELTESANIKPENKKPYTLPIGFYFLECHKDCISKRNK